MKLLITFFRVFMWLLAVLAGTLLLLAIAMLKPIDQRKIVEYQTVTSTLAKLDSLTIDQWSAGGVLEASWAVANIMPERAINMAGYGPRGPYNAVLDSLKARIVLFDNGGIKAVIICVDVLMFPRALKEKLEKRLPTLGFQPMQISFTATHTHHGFGNWESSPAGSFAFGTYEETLVDHMANRIIEATEAAAEKKAPITICFQKIDAGNMVANRLAPESGAEDPYLRIVHLKKNNGERGMLVSFAGHATNLDADVWEVSRDYPGVLVDLLEQEPHIDFAMFAAGMVGSHNIDSGLSKGHNRIITIGKHLAALILNDSTERTYNIPSKIGSADVDIALPASQLRLTGSIALRDWVFKAAFKPLEAHIRLLQIGDILFIGMPCDYSGELAANNHLDTYAARHNKKLFITSFNGNYVGYITEDAHYYTSDHDEVRVMNWVGPGMGAYFTTAVRKIIDSTE